MQEAYSIENLTNYCHSRYQAVRRETRRVPIGPIGIGGNEPIRVQSMTTSNTLDIDATVKQTLELAEVGCEIVRITAPSNAAARALKEISKKVRAANCQVPLVADIHFIPSAAMEAVEHVEKVRVNPGNYADKKRFKQREYTDQEYDDELHRLHEAFSPLVKRAKELGRTLRIGTNHGSLSDRIMNRYGDTPMGMVESALEFTRICEAHGFYDIVLSLKASNPKVMIAAYRLAAAKMETEGMKYPLHLGVTEAGDGEDARIKSAIGIGSLLYDGLGDTIRVSLTEDSVHEIPVAKDLADKAAALWKRNENNAREIPTSHDQGINPFDYRRRLTYELPGEGHVRLGAAHPPRVIASSVTPPATAQEWSYACNRAHEQLEDATVEGIICSVSHPEDLKELATLPALISPDTPYLVLDIEQPLSPECLEELPPGDNKRSWIICLKQTDHENLNAWIQHCREQHMVLALNLSPGQILQHENTLKHAKHLLFTRTEPDHDKHAVGTYRALAQTLSQIDLKAPIWIRAGLTNSMNAENRFSSNLLESSMLAGSLFCDGIGDVLSIETEDDLQRSTGLAYNILQAAKMRISRTEYVACPSCGRTLFDLQSTTQKIRERTGHLKGVTIAVMGCIVNGPGEMADADFGYVGGAPGKVNLYVSKTCVKKNIPENEAVDRLVDLIDEHDMWQEPAPTP